MTTAEKTVYEKAVSVITSVVNCLEENNYSIEEAWETVRKASKLTNDEMNQCALIVTTCKA